MRILALTTSFPSNCNPVSGIFIRHMLQTLPGSFQVTVLTPDTRHPSAHSERQGSLRVHSFRYAPRVLQTLAHRSGGIPAALQQKPLRWFLVPVFCMAMLLATWRQLGKAELIHANWAPSGVIAGLAGRLRGVPAVTSIRGTDMSWAVRFPWSRWILRLCLLLNYKVVTVSEAMALQLTEWFPHQRIKLEMIPNGVNLKPPMASPATSGGFTFVVIGNLIPQKNVDLVIHALANLSKTHANARLCIIGDGSQKMRLHRLTHDLGVNRLVDFKGQLPPEQTMDHLACCQTLILASTSEGRPNVVLEAMAAGVPVIASDIHGVRELIAHDERGLLFVPGDLAQLAGQMGRLLTQPDLGRRLAANARRWVQAQGLTWENTAARYADLYRLVLSEHRHGKI